MISSGLVWPQLEGPLLVTLKVVNLPVMILQELPEDHDFAEPILSRALVQELN
jgi:hypothetical protein